MSQSQAYDEGDYSNFTPISKLEVNLFVLSTYMYIHHAFFYAGYWYICFRR